MAGRNHGCGPSLPIAYRCQSTSLMSCSARLYQQIRRLRLANIDQQRVAAALVDARRYFDGSVVGYFRQQLDACMADDGELGPLKTLPIALVLLRAIEQHAREVRSPVRRELLSRDACGAEFVGWLYREPYYSAMQAPSLKWVNRRGQRWYLVTCWKVSRCRDEIPIISDRDARPRLLSVVSQTRRHGSASPQSA